MRLSVLMALVLAVLAATVSMSGRFAGTSPSEAAPAPVCSTQDALADPDGDGVASGHESAIGTDPCTGDSDGDECIDGNEINTDPVFGGDRLPTQTDFFDSTGDHAVDIFDTVDILGAFGAMAGSAQAAGIDRYSPDPLKPWRAVTANDGIDLRDALTSLKSFGHNCSESTLIPQCPTNTTATRVESPVGAGTVGTITVSNVASSGGAPTSFDWSATDPLKAVYVKSATTYASYDYGAGASASTGLTAPGNSAISQALFCTAIPQVVTPPGCNTAAGSGAAQIDAPGTIPPVVQGQTINYRLQVTYPEDPTETLCQAFNVDVWLKLPGAASFTIACSFATISEGETKQCPTLVPYVANGADRTAGVLQAFLFAIGDKHDQDPGDCITSPDNPNAPLGPVCFGAQVTSNIAMPNTPTPTPTNTPTRTPTNTPTASSTPVTPGPCETPDAGSTPTGFNGLVKSIDCEMPDDGTLLVNLWLCYDQSDDDLDNNGDSTVDNEPPTCLNNGEGVLEIDELIFTLVDCDTRNDDDDGDGEPVSNDPASPGYRPECPSPTMQDYIDDNDQDGNGNVDKNGGELPEGLGAFEFQLKFDHKIFDITIVSDPDDAWANGRIVDCSMTIITENDIRFGCITSGPGLGLPFANGQRGAIIVVLPEDDLRFRIRPTKDNGIVRKILDENCEVADIYGDIFPGTNAGLTPECTDVDITVRRLEGDMDGDCDVDSVDSQLMNWRFQAFFGSLYYDPFFDLEPWPTGDFDIDIKDLQFVNGRVGSTCANPIPDNQDPLPGFIVALP